MKENNSNIENIDWSLATFEGAEREQLRRFAKLTLDDILKALEEMADFSSLLKES